MLQSEFEQMENDVDTLEKKMKTLRTRFDEMRNEVIQRLDEWHAHIQTSEKLLEEIVAKNTTLVTELANLSNDEKEWKEIKVKLATTAVKGKVILDVGGDKYTTNVDTLTREKDTFFTALFSKQCQLERDPNDQSIFIDRDGKLFAHVLAYLRTNHVSDDVMNNLSLRKLLIIEAKYFHLHHLTDLLTKPEQNSEAYFPDGSLLNVEQKKKLNEFYGTADQKWQLIYKATRDGFSGSAFHRFCDNRGATMTVILSNNNYLFGGYTSLAWTSDGYSKNDPKAFLFTLTNPHGIAPTKYLINAANAANAVSHVSNYGPTFGGYDLYVGDKSNENASSHTNFPASYLDSTGKGNVTFTGACNFTTADIEVYALVSL